MSLVLELQRLALDNSIDVSELLKKAYAVAYKLKLRSFRAWADCEMNGYINKKMPPYRRIQGNVVCRNPYRGWIPFICEDRELQANLATRWINTPVAVLQEFLRNNTSDRSIIYFEPQLEALLMKDMEYPPFRPALDVPRSAYNSILDRVRNIILEWSLKLEADGILGEGQTFTASESKTAQEKAAELRPLVQVYNNNVSTGTMQASAVQQASPQGTMYFDVDEA